jgi:hypothetical protein
VTVLLLRLGHQAWGPLPGAGEVTAHPVRLEITDAAGVCPDWSLQAVVYEWRCLPPPSGLLPWDAIPPLVTASADWIERKSAEFADHTVLLGTTMPPEAALDLGSSPARPSAPDGHRRAALALYWSAGGDHRLRMFSQSASSGDSAGAMYRAPGKAWAGRVKLPRATSRPMLAR